MSASNFKTENNSYRKLIGNGLTYSVPSFQRDYSWGEQEWEDLWLDLLATIKENGGGYLASKLNFVSVNNFVIVY